MALKPKHKTEHHLDSTPSRCLVIVLSGPSGVGKDAVLEKLMALGKPLYFVITATTRPQRPGEKDSVNHIFVNHIRFQELVKQGEFLEYAEVYGNWYGVPKAQVEIALNKGIDVIIRTDVQGAATIKKKLPESILIFLMPPTEEDLYKRLRHRGTESAQALIRRLDTAKHEMDQLPLFDHVVVNHHQGTDEAAKQLDSIIATEKARVLPRSSTK